jgi:hypothetical protein
MFPEAARQIVHPDDLEAQTEAMVGDVGADESGHSGDEYTRHAERLLFEHGPRAGLGYGPSRSGSRIISVPPRPIYSCAPDPRAHRSVGHG